MNDLINKKRLAIIGLIGAMATILLSSSIPDLFEELEWKTLDMRFELRGSIHTESNLVLIDADDSSVGVYGNWPWKRSVQASMIRFLNETVYSFPHGFLIRLIAG